MSSATLQDEPWIDEFFNLVAVETLPLFEYLSFDFLSEYDVFAPAHRGRTRDHHPPELFRGFLHCFYRGIYGPRPVTRELQNTAVWLSCGFDRSPSRDAADRFLTDLGLVVDDVFSRLVEQAAARGLLDSTFRIDSTDLEALAWNGDASWNYDLTAEEYYYGFGLTIASAGSNIPTAAEFTQAKQASKETAMRVTCDALAIKCPIWMLGDSAYDILDWHDFLLEAGVVPIAPYNARNTTDPLDIEYRIEDRINEFPEDVTLKRLILNETYKRRTQVERTFGACLDCGLGTLRARGRVHARVQAYLGLCLRVIVAITNYEQGENPGRTKLVA
ncbi:transposase [Natronobiforma cellulositropha]|uniref:transposase n=1 Tax=Natronobiforma cellulositropha TaxID=1679076 RepID=UPI0021D5A568|nr:transposase [Natronobiforma cellulositropha]